MAAKAKIVSIETIKPSTPTPKHLRDLKLSLLDQLIPHQIYFPLFLCYSHHDINNAFGGTGDHFSIISQKLKTSLSHALTLYYPYCGKSLKDNISIDCNDMGVAFIESKVHVKLSDILNNPKLELLVKDFFPFDPFNFDEQPEANLAVQLTQFSCGGIALAVPFDHKVGDGSTSGYFLRAWALLATGQGSLIEAPQIETSLLYFPPSRNIPNINFRDVISKEELASKVCHVVNLRSLIDPPLPEVTRGNLIVHSLSPSLELKGEVGLHDFAEMARKAVIRVDKDYVSKFVVDGIIKVVEEMKATKEEGVPVYTFSSLMRVDFYGIDFGWGKPTWVGTVGRRRMKNAVMLFPTRDGKGTEAWITLSKVDMVQFERNPELIQYTSVNC
ncbi:unnamed protein product [Lupinus luteus]|uniref:Uncharacterized protein n=1 Tax=Lupinus luteus TaxID=3873 RepID=A0AAV1YJY6_LUPLU